MLDSLKVRVGHGNKGRPYENWSLEIRIRSNPKNGNKKREKKRRGEGDYVNQLWDLRVFTAVDS